MILLWILGLTILWALRHHMVSRADYYFARSRVVIRVIVASVTYTYTFAPSLMSGGFVVFPLPASLALPIALVEHRQGAETIVPILSLVVSFFIFSAILIARNKTMKTEQTAT